MNKSISELQKEIHELAKSKGWYDGPKRNPLELLMLVVTEISEAVEEIRNDTKGEVTELADAVIRIMDYCEFNKLNLEEAINKKHEYNKTRPYRHGNKKY